MSAALLTDNKLVEYNLRFALCSTSSKVTGARALCTEAGLADFGRKWAVMLLQGGARY